MVILFGRYLPFIRRKSIWNSKFEPTQGGRFAIYFPAVKPGIFDMVNNCLLLFDSGIVAARTFSKSLGRRDNGTDKKTAAGAGFYHA